ncbi:AlpA family phage regulatory protein [Mesorhizobium sp. BR1-1-3]|uniref:AlpA family phage regulatory protein n=1 Tax=Mesorhizobium sp. BR1-1-3 TaxID=2876651 RepID=UPI001CD08AEA|nr:AlpA family phage regulatory protein [Mesorhizobium sp. BR1-1-3]MBZ9888163.1 AlpA family phage regulatory protein [Mesorhizobium sp. BR1-1-3]
MGRDLAALATDLYRFYDMRGRLLYVGISVSALTRMQQHMKDKPWFQDVSDITIEKFETRELAVAAEELAIRTEMPIYNKSQMPTIREHVRTSSKSDNDAPVAAQWVPAVDGIDSFLRLKEVMRIVALGSSTIYRRIEAGTFPRPFVLSPSCVRWKESDIRTWMNALQATGVAA